MTSSTNLIHLKPNSKGAKYWILDLVHTKDKKGNPKLDWIMSKPFTPAEGQIAVVCLGPGQTLHSENCRVIFP